MLQCFQTYEFHNNRDINYISHKWASWNIPIS